MVSRKRTASEALLPTRAPKQPRMAVNRSEAEPEVHASPSNGEGLLSRWVSLMRETLDYFVGRETNPSSYQSSNPPLSPPLRPPNPAPPLRGLPPRSPIPHFQILPPTPVSTDSQSNTQSGRTSYSMTIPSSPGPSSLRSLDPAHDKLQLALSRSNIPARLTAGNAVFMNGVHKKYRPKEHIYSKTHKTKVREALELRLFQMSCVKGYSSDFATFRGFLAYKERLEQLQAVPSVRPTSKSPDDRSVLNPVNDVFFERAIQKARKTFESPKPPKPFLPSIDQLKQSIRARNEEIDRRLHPKRPSLPLTLPPDAKAEVDRLLQKQGIVSKLEKEQVTNRDLDRLRPGQWLNDELINFYGQLILSRSIEADAAKENGKTYLNVHYFSTFFWPKLQTGYEKSRLAKWTKKVDIFSKDIVLIPINHGNAHWTMSAINFRCKRIESYDSMRLDRSQVYKSLRMYVDDEHKNKKKKPFDFSGWGDYDFEDTPEQENGFDCGVFTCQFMESLSRGEDSFGFTQRDMPYLRQRMIWEIGQARLWDTS